jgi:drug/metabolite transporter (DMT)-like permease
MPVPGFKIYSALILVQVLFGLNYIFSKIIVDNFPPLLWGSIRIIIASAVMMSVAYLSGRKAPPRDRSFFVPLIGFALLGIIINQSSFLIGLRLTTSTNSAVLNTLIPIFTLLVVTLRGQEALTTTRVAGFVSAFLGVLVLRKVEEFTLSNQTFVGDLLTMLNCFSYALFLSYSKKFLERNDRIWTTAWLFVYGSIGITALSIPSWQGFHWPPMTPLMVGSMCFSVLGGTLATYFLNIWALAHARSSSVALFIYLQPMIAAVVAWGFFGQPITLRVVLASALILQGMLFSLANEIRAALSKRLT